MYEEGFEQFLEDEKITPQNNTEAYLYLIAAHTAALADALEDIDAILRKISRYHLGLE